MKKVFVLIALGLILFGCIQGNGSDKNASVPAVYSTQEECEEKNDCECNFVMCDYIPEGKTFEEVCGKGFEKGWKCVNTTLKEGVNEMSKTVEAGDTIKVEYIGSFPDTKEVFDQSNGNPLEFTAGAGQMIKGFDKAVIGMKLNEEKTVLIPPEEAYGLAGRTSHPLAGKTLQFWIKVVEINKK
ncbi:MAG: FKBP-type peptidyl-prolyl cis-trans isomerase [archaeon]